MQLHNSLSRSLQSFMPLDDDKVRIYSCGPTVYDHIHIGNLSAFVVADTVRRILQDRGYYVEHVMNFTDVDDKTIRRSRESYPEFDPKAALEKLTGDYSAIFLDDMAAVGNDVSAYTFVKATDAIPRMQELIRELYNKKFAYITDDGVYFSISAYKNSGKQYGQLIDLSDSTTSEARIDNDEYDKEDAHDFALWKVQKPGEPAWDFELEGQNLAGRPGWHIECSAMSTQTLGQPFDIHTGGVDLKFPHHENEIAQSTAGHDNSVYAQTFIHNEHLLVDGQKMSKSLNNFITLKDIEQKGFDPLAFRLLVLQSHYRNQAHFSWDNLEAAQNRLSNWRRVADLRWQATTQALQQPVFEDSLRGVRTALESDLGLPQALAEVSQVLAQVETNLIHIDNLLSFHTYLQSLDLLFGLGLSNSQDISDEQKQLVREREAAREHKDWAKSDELRDTLAEQGIGVRDTTAGAIWFRV